MSDKVLIDRELLGEALIDLESGMMCNPSADTLHRLRTLLSAQPQARACVTCGEPTRFDKPYCEEHCYELPQASAAQSAPAGEREAFELASIDDNFGSLRALGAEAERHGLEDGDYIDFAARKAWEYFQAGAAWQRTQAAWVPDVSAMARVLSDRSADACNIDRTDNWAMYGQEYIEDVQAMLASAPAQPAALTYKDDPRSPSELSLAGCRCVRFGEGNPHWPCRQHRAGGVT